MTWTKDTVKAWIQNSDINNLTHRAALSRALIFLYNRQTTDEQSSHTTSHDNGVGFSGYDAEFLSSVALGVQRYGSMTVKQAECVKKRLARYSGQLLLMLDPSHIQSPAPRRARAVVPASVAAPLFNQEAASTLQAMF